MKKTMVFENELAFVNWFDVNEEKEGGYDFLKNRVVIIKSIRTFNGKKFNGFSADATINCKNIETAVRRFVKELNSNGFEVSVDEFEGSCNGENLRDLTGPGMLVAVEKIDDEVFFVNYMCYQNEVEETTETANTTPEISNKYEGTEEELAVEQFERLTGTLYKSLFKAIGLEETKKIPFIISNNMVFFNYNGVQYKYYPSQCKIFKKCDRKYQRINWKDFADDNSPTDQKQALGRSPPLLLI